MSVNIILTKHKIIIKFDIKVLEIQFNLKLK